VIRRLLLGALLGLLTVFPTLLAAVGRVVAAIAAHPVVVAFALRVLARPVLAHRMRGWAR
jgi:hypothetical protein